MRHLPPLRPLALLACLSLASCGDSASRDSGGAPPRQVLVILLDAARSDRMSCYGYERETTPNIDALAQRGVICERNYTQGTNTRRALPCMLFSRYFTIPVFPFDSGVPMTRPEDLFRTVDDECVSIPRHFEQSGLLTAGITAHTWTKADTLFAREFQEWHDLSEELEVEEGYPYPRGEEVIDYALEWVDDHEDEDWFLYLHLMDTHFPHYFEEDARHFHPGTLPSLERFSDSGFVLDNEPMLTDAERAYLDALYDGSMRYTDRHLGRLFDALENGPLLEHGVLAIVSDHGEGLMERSGFFDHGGPWLEPVARIPMIFVGDRRVPRISGGRVDTPTGLIDLLPTLAGLMELELPPGVRPDGIDLTPSFRGEPAGRNHVGIDGGLVMGEWKALFEGYAERIVAPDAKRHPAKVQGELYDLSVDPREENDLRKAESARWISMVESYRELLGPSFQRHDDSTVNRPPPGPFAIASWSFGFNAAVPKGPPQLRGKLDPLADDAWHRSTLWPDFYLLAKGAAPGLTVEFEIPDGRYAVEIEMAGALEVRLAGDGTPRRVSAAPFQPWRPAETELVDLGDVLIEDRTFRAELEVPDSSDYVLIRSIGFVPEGGEATSEEAQARLRELGY